MSVAKPAFTGELVSYLLDSASDASLVSEALRLLAASGRPFAVDAADTMADVLESRTSAPEARSALLLALSESDRPAARYVQARLLAAWGKVEEAITAISATLGSLPASEPALLAARARWLVKQKRFAEAGVDLRAAFDTHPAYSFYVRTERLLEKVVSAKAIKSRRTIRLALLSSSTTGLLAPVLRAACFTRGIELELYEGVYGSYRQEVLDPTSGLYRFRPDAVVFLVNSHDLDLPPRGGAQQVEAFCQELRELWSALQAKNPCHIVQVGFESPAGGAWGSLEDSLPDGRRRMIAHANELLLRELPTGVSFLNVDVLAPGVPLESLQEWHASRQFPRADALPLFADAICAQLRAAVGLSSKVLVLDLDNTLWGGVIGEDGLGGIRIGPPTAEGEAHRALQLYAKELQARGVLLAVCSKNNLADAQAPFQSHADMVLKLDDFVSFKANWEDKATNLVAMAKELSLGLDSFVFLDDNPVERSWIRSQVPEVTVPDGGTTPWALLASLQRGMYFDSVALTSEDLERKQSYAATAALQQVQQSGASLEGFLQGLNMVATHGPVDANTIARVTQLVNKTNQFNVTTRRYSAEQVKQFAESPEWWCRWFRLADRFGDHGLIGTIFARIEGDTWFVDTWLMSCRVLGRHLEEFMCGQLLTAAAARGALSVVGEYLPTDKNAMAADLFPRMGFANDVTPGRFRFELATQQPLPAPWIQSRTEG